MNGQAHTFAQSYACFWRFYVVSSTKLNFFYDESQNRFLELGSILDPGRPPKTDKAAILVDAVRMVNQLRSEAQKLKESNSSLQEKIKELKASLHDFLTNDTHAIT